MIGGGPRVGLAHPRCSLCPASFSPWASRGDRRFLPSCCRSSWTILLFSTARRRKRLDRRPRIPEPHACRAAECQARRIRRSEGVTCRSRSCSFVLAMRRTCTLCTRWSARPAAAMIVHRRRSDSSSSRVDSRSGAGARRRWGAISVTSGDPAGWNWLAGRRSPTENWDAFEAPGGGPLLSTPSTSDWREVHAPLSSLAVELDASVREAREEEEMNSRPTLAHVWKRPDGHLVRLDFPWPETCRIERKSALSALSSYWRQSRSNCVAPGHRAGRAPVGHDAVASTGERVAASAG